MPSMVMMMSGYHQGHHRILLLVVVVSSLRQLILKKYHLTNLNELLEELLKGCLKRVCMTEDQIKTMEKQFKESRDEGDKDSIIGDYYDSEKKELNNYINTH